MKKNVLSFNKSTGLLRSYVTNMMVHFGTGELNELKTTTFWVQNIKMPFEMGHPHLHIKSSLYVCWRAQGSQIFKQNSIILIHSHFTIIQFRFFSSKGVGQAGGSYLG